MQEPQYLIYYIDLNIKYFSMDILSDVNSTGSQNKIEAIDLPLLFKDLLGGAILICIWKYDKSWRNFSDSIRIEALLELGGYEIRVSQDTSYDSAKKDLVAAFIREYYNLTPYYLPPFYSLFENPFTIQMTISDRYTGQ